ncbi:MAG: NAD(P)/FAD-dependent oxidoreductase [Clostridiaceae bacterium]
MKKYDLIVIGTGVAGLTAAHTCREAGLTVAVIDKLPFGGTCALRACDPKKVLLGAAEIMDRVNRMNGLGIEEGSRVRWEDLMNFKRTFTKGFSENNEKGYLSAGIDTYHGVASFTSESEIIINDVKLAFNHLLIASGAKPAPLHIEGEEFVVLSDDFLELEHLPKRVVFIGGGFISFEFAHLTALAGSEVHILHRNRTPLKNFDQDLVSLLVKRTEELGIHLHLNTEPTKIEKIEDRYIVHVVENGKDMEIECDMVFHGAGRIPDVEDLDLEKGKVAQDKRGITVNEFLQSVSNEKVYSAGDSAASKGLPFTSVATRESPVVAENILKGNLKQLDYSLVPSIVFTQPKLAMIGLTEAKAVDKGYEITVNRFDTTGWYTYKRTHEAVAMTKTITDKKTGKLIGVHILGSNADELINYFALIMKFDLPYEEVKNMFFAYPTSASDIEYFI